MTAAGDQMGLFAAARIPGDLAGKRRADDYYPTPPEALMPVIPLLRMLLPPALCAPLRVGPPVGAPVVLEPGVGHGAIAQVLVAPDDGIDAHGRPVGGLGLGGRVVGLDVAPEAVAETRRLGIAAWQVDCTGDGAVEPTAAGRAKRPGRERAGVVDPPWSARGGRWWACPDGAAVAPIGAAVGNVPFGLALPIVRRCLGWVQPGGVVATLLRLSWLEPVGERREFLAEHPFSVWVLPRRPSFAVSGKSRTDSVTSAWFVWRKPRDYESVTLPGGTFGYLRETYDATALHDLHARAVAAFGEDAVARPRGV